MQRMRWTRHLRPRPPDEARLIGLAETGTLAGVPGRGIRSSIVVLRRAV
jgi:hypothetical protein